MIWPEVLADQPNQQPSRASAPASDNNNNNNNKPMKLLKKVGWLLAAALLVNSTPAFGGDTGALSKSVMDKTAIEPKPASSPLCFYDGRLCFDVQERVRFEARNNNFDFNDSVNALTDDAFVLQRFRIGVAIKPADWLKIYAQGQDSREIDSDRPNIPGALAAEGDDAFDLRQAYVQVGPKWLNVTAGRQTLSYGDERLVGAFDWNNFGRVFDAVKLHYEQPKFSVDLFASSVVNIYRDSINLSDLFNGSETHRDQVFSGLYVSTTALEVQTTDFYVFVLNQNNAVPTAPAITSPTTSLGLTDDRTDFVTIGTRIKADPKKLHGFEYEGEFAFQTGNVRGLDLTAFAAHAGLGYNFMDAPWKPRLSVEYNFATGDNNSTDGDIETFQNLFPTNHKFYGYIDAFSWQNLHNPAISLRVTPTAKLTAQLDGHAFFLATNEDAWYRANGVARVRPLNGAARDASKFAGTEIDFTVNYKATKHLALQAGYSHFFAGDYLGDTGTQDDADFGYVMATLSF